MSGGILNEVTCCAPCPLWQSTQVAWRLLFSRAPRRHRADWCRWEMDARSCCTRRRCWAARERHWIRRCGRHAVRLIGSAQQSGAPTRCAGVTGNTGIAGDRSVAAQFGLDRDFVRGHGVTPDGPSRHRIHLVLPAMLVRVGSWQARHICPLELSRTRKFMRELVDGLHVRVVARGAFHIAVNQLDCAGGVAGLALEPGWRSDRCCPAAA